MACFVTLCKMHYDILVHASDLLRHATAPNPVSEKGQNNPQEPIDGG